MNCKEDQEKTREELLDELIKKYDQPIPEEIQKVIDEHFWDFL
jgi:hypothetical protein